MNLHRWDFIPAEMMQEEHNVPHGFDFWDPSWKLVDGKIVKPENKMDQNNAENVKIKTHDGKPAMFFKCDCCEYNTLDQQEIIRHVATHGIQESKAEVEEVLPEAPAEVAVKKRRGRPRKVDNESSGDAQ